MQLIPYLNFAGNCGEAFDFYRDVLGGEILSRFTYGESPMAVDMPPESHAQIMHTHLQSGGATLMGADGPPPHPQAGQGSFVNIAVDSADEAERIWKALSEGAEVRMPLQETFWARRFGMLVDRFGKPWMVNCSLDDCTAAPAG
jgi:PhnB protein